MSQSQAEINLVKQSLKLFKAEIKKIEIVLNKLPLTRVRPATGTVVKFFKK